MAGRKTGDFHMRVDPDNRAEWDRCAREHDMSLAMWLECIANREAERQARARLVRTIYPQKSAALPLGEGAGRGKS
jgi:hypothetical protein